MKFGRDPSYREKVLSDLKRRARSTSLARTQTRTGVTTDRRAIEKHATRRTMRFIDGVVRDVMTVPVAAFGSILGVAHKTPHVWVAMGHMPSPIARLAGGQETPRYTVEEAWIYARLLDAHLRRVGCTQRTLFKPANSPSGQLYAARNAIAKRAMGVA